MKSGKAGAQLWQIMARRPRALRWFSVRLVCFQMIFERKEYLVPKAAVARIAAFARPNALFEESVLH